MQFNFGFIHYVKFYSIGNPTNSRVFYFQNLMVYYRTANIFRDVKRFILCFFLCLSLVQSAYNKYTTTDALWTLFPYDYCSCTHNQPSDFSMPGTPAFTIPATAPVRFIPQPQLCTLSKTDCQLISMMYGCDSSQCTQRKYT